MASKGAEYLTELWDSLVNGKRNKEKRNTATEEIENIIAGYEGTKVPMRPFLPDVPQYERMDYEAPSDDTLQKRAESELQAYKEQGEKGVENKIDALREGYEAEKKAAEEKRGAAESQTTESYAEAKRNTDNDMLKRGLARSSIAANKKAALEEGEAAKKAQLAADYARRADELNGKIEALRAERESALNGFNLSYAARLTSRMNELREERDKKAAEALKYNNTLAEKEHAARVDKTMKESDLYGEALTQRKKENELRETDTGDYEALYTAIAAQLRTVNKNDARDIVLNNPNVRNSLNGTYYYKLYNEFCR